MKGFFFHLHRKKSKTMKRTNTEITGTVVHLAAFLVLLHAPHSARVVLPLYGAPASVQPGHSALTGTSLWLCVCQDEESANFLQLHDEARTCDCNHGSLRCTVYMLDSIARCFCTSSGLPLLKINVVLVGLQSLKSTRNALQPCVCWRWSRHTLPTAWCLQKVTSYHLN